MADVWDALLGTGNKPGLLDRLGTTGEKAENLTKIYAGLVGPVGAKSAPPAPATPAPAPAGLLPEPRGFLGLPFSPGVVIAGAASLALIVYLFLRGK